VTVAFGGKQDRQNHFFRATATTAYAVHLPYALAKTYVRFTLKPDETTINRYGRYLGKRSRSATTTRMTVYRSEELLSN
jgi:hypothetical protein